MIFREILGIRVKLLLRLGAVKIFLSFLSLNYILFIRDRYILKFEQ